MPTLLLPHRQTQYEAVISDEPTTVVLPISVPRQFSLVAQMLISDGYLAGNFAPARLSITFVDGKTVRVGVPCDGTPIRLLAPIGIARVSVFGYGGHVLVWAEEPQNYEVECDD